MKKLISTKNFEEDKELSYEIMLSKTPAERFEFAFVLSAQMVAQLPPERLKYLLEKDCDGFILRKEK